MPRRTIALHRRFNPGRTRRRSQLLYRLHAPLLSPSSTSASSPTGGSGFLALIVLIGAAWAAFMLAQKAQSTAGSHRTVWRAGRCPHTFPQGVAGHVLRSRADRIVETFQSAYASQVGRDAGASAYFIGIWDAVAAIGWQRFSPDWAYDRHFPSDIQYARHLQSIDEVPEGF